MRARVKVNKNVCGVGPSYVLGPRQAKCLGPEGPQYDAEGSNSSAV